MSAYERTNIKYGLAGIAICVVILCAIWFGIVAPQLVPVWTDSGKIQSITPSQGAFLKTWDFTVVTVHHGTVSPVTSNCGWEVEGNTIYVTLLHDGKYAQTDNAGNILQCNG